MEGGIVIANLYERHNYLNKNISYLINNEIIEYDMSSAGFNVLKRYNLLSLDALKRLERLNKKDRQVRIGLMMREDRALGKALSEGFVKIRKEFFEANDVREDDILSIKKDALFCLKRFHILTFGNIEFIEKNNFTSYYYINRKEFYYSSFKDTLDVKGIADDKLELHQDYMIKVLKYIFKLFETSDSHKIIRELKEFSSEYKNKNLDIQYYRELSINSNYRVKEGFYFKDKVINVSELGNDYMDIIETGYNYMKYVVPLVSILT